LNIRDLIFDDKNANKGTARGRGMLEKSLSKYGAGRSILLDKNNRIIAGNKTCEVAGEIGMENIQIVESDGSKIIAVKRTDLDLKTDKAARELAFADNRISEIDLSWSAEEIASAQADGVAVEDFFNDEELDALTGDEETEKLSEKELELKPYNKVHILISIDVDKIQNVTDMIDQLRKIDGVEIETKAN